MSFTPANSVRGWGLTVRPGEGSKHGALYTWHLVSGSYFIMIFIILIIILF